MRKYLPLALTIIVMQALAFLTSYFVTEAAVNSWYQMIDKGPLSPPDWLFAPVWAVLYTLLAISLWLFWKQRFSQGGKITLAAFIAQLTANYAWSFLFFGMRAFGAAVVLLIIIDVLTAATIMLGIRVQRTAALLLLPYLAWICFATYLSYNVMALNP